MVKLLGDGALIEFPSASEAMASAVAIQRELRKPDTRFGKPETIMLRAGLHVGDVTVHGEDIFGDGLNIASRLQEAAQPGGILASRVFCDLAGSDIGVGLLGEGVHTFKGVKSPIEVLSVNFSDEESVRRREGIAKQQEIRLPTTRDDVRVAWTTNGSGPPLVKTPNWIGHFDYDWQDPAMGSLLGSLASKYELFRFDAPGNGLSDCDVEDISFDRMVDDIEEVFDTAGMSRASLIGLSQGAAYAVAFAARHPGRVSAIVTIGGVAVGRAKRKSKKERHAARAYRALI